jgi:hypothetical protein
MLAVFNDACMPWASEFVWIPNEWSFQGFYERRSNVLVHWCVRSRNSRNICFVRSLESAAVCAVGSTYFFMLPGWKLSAWPSFKQNLVEMLTVTYEIWNNNELSVCLWLILCSYETITWKGARVEPDLANSYSESPQGASRDASLPSRVV